MGLLDDAIREHLDLKRRRGADPAEIERAEREALGPVRRGPEERQLSELDAPTGTADFTTPAPDFSDELLDEDERDPFEPVEEHDFDDYAFEDRRQHETAPPTGPSPSAQRSDPRAAGKTPSPVRAADAPPPPGDTPPPPGDSGGDETIEWDVESALDEESSEQRDDVLEETPEFLQDTPEHDRLWFEQRPPRDFDFNG